MPCRTRGCYLHAMTPSRPNSSATICMMSPREFSCEIGQNNIDSARGSALDEHIEGVVAGAVVSFNLSARVTYALNTMHPTQQVHLELPLH